jgi:DNA-binding NtrC family response regulator
MKRWMEDGRISWIRIENKQANIIMINAYASTENSKEEYKIKFYDKLEKIVALRNATMAIGRSRRPRGPTYARGANR